MIEAISEKTIRLLLESESLLTSKKIAQEINMSESSVKHNMKEVRRIVHSANAILNSVPGKGFWIEANDEQLRKLQQIILENRDKSYSFNYRKNYILNILFQNNAEYTMQIFADDLGVGKNIINKDLERIERWLSFFDIKVTRIRNKGIQIHGAEFDIRQAIIYNNASLMDEMSMNLTRPDDLDFRISKTFYNYFVKTYTKNDIYYFQDILLCAERELCYQFSDVSFIQLIEYITVTYNRMHKNCFVLENNILNRCRITVKEYEAARQLIYMLAQNVQAFLMVEMRCMAAQFSLYGTYEEATNSVIKDEYYANEALNFLGNLQEIMVNKKLLINDSLVEDISTLFKKKKMQKSFQIINSNYLKRDIKTQLPSLYGIVLANIQPLENSLNLKFTDNDIAYFVMLIDNALEDTSDELSIALITSFDYNTATYLKNKIKRSIEHIRIKKVIFLEELEKEDLNKYDIVLTTVLLDLKSVIKISRRVDNQDLIIIMNVVEKIIKQKQLIITNIQQLFSRDLIVHNLKVKRKEEAIEKGVELLKERGYVNSAFYQVLIQRENFVSTAIGNGVAIPHGFKKEIKKSGVACIKLDRSIDWNESEKVDLVFIIAINSDDRKEIYEFFARFYSLMNDETRLEKVRGAKNELEIYNLLEDIGSVKQVN